MSRAFVKETEPDEPVPLVDPVLPPGARNVITSAGASRLRAEAEALQQERRQLKASPSVEGQVRLAVVERRLAWFQRRSPSWVEVPPVVQTERVRLGCRLRVEDAAGQVRELQILGVDELEGAQGGVSWLSPIAQALLGAEVSDSVLLHRPGGDEELSVLAILPGNEGTD